MADVIGEAVVLIRPDSTGFEAEATPGITSAGSSLGRKLGKAILAGLALGGITEGLKSVVDAATQQNTAFAVLDQTLKNAGQSVSGFSASLHDKLEVEARATGVSTTDLAAAMNRLVPATGNAATSLKDLNTAIGISESYHISLSTAALALAKAETGSFTSLQRYLGLIPKVTTAEDALKAEYAAATENGAKLDATSKALYESRLKEAQATDRTLTSQNALNLAAEKFGGIPQTFAQSYQGEFDRLHVGIEQLKVAIGTDLVGGLASGSASLADFIDKLLASNKVQQDGAALAHDAGGALHDLGAVAEAIGPPLLEVAKDTAEIVKTIGAPPILAAVAAYKAFGIVQGVTAAATSLYNRALLANVGITTDAIAETNVLAVSNTRLSASYTEAGLASALTTEERGVAAFGSGLLALAPGGALIGGAVVGVGALAGVIYELSTRESAWTSANDRAKSSVGDLVSAVNTEKTAVDNLNAAIKTGNSASIVAARGAAAQAAKDESDSLQKSAETIGQIAAAATAPQFQFVKLPGGSERVEQVYANGAAQVAKFKSGLDALSLSIGDQDPVLTHNIGLVEQLTAQLGKVPSKHDVEILIDNLDLNAKLSTIQGEFELAGAKSGTDFALAFNTSMIQSLESVGADQGAQSAVGAFLSQFDQIAEAVKKDAKSGKTYTAMTDAAKATLQTLAQAVSTDKSDIAQYKENLADAITQGAQSVAQAVEQAKQNLNSIGKSLSDEIQSILTDPITKAETALTAAQNRLSLTQSKTTLQRLGEEVLLPGGKRLSSNPEQALAQLQALEKKTKSPGLTDFIQQYESALYSEQGASLTVTNDALTALSTRAGQRIANLTDLFNTHKLTQGQFGSRLSGLLKSLGITPSVAGSEFGISGADTLRGLEQGLIQQAGAIAAGPQQAGSGLVPTITRPLDTLNSVTRTIRDDARTQRQAIIKLGTDTNKYLKALAGDKATTKFVTSLAKNPGKETQTTAALTGVPGT